MRSVSDIARPSLAAASILAVALWLCAFAGAARAATAPIAITGPVTATAATTATLSGTVNPNGDPTSWHFEYGKTASYGTSTAATSAGAGTANTGVSANTHRPLAGHHLPLPPRRLEQRRHDERRRRHLHHLVGRAAHGHGHDHCRLGRHDHLGDAQRLDQPERPPDDLLLRVRLLDVVRHEDGRPERRLRHDHRRRLGHDLRAPGRADLPLPARRDERRRDDPGRRHELRHGRRPARRSPPGPRARSARRAPG